jgi:hypothetical protein
MHQNQDYVIEVSIFTENQSEMLYNRQYQGLRRHQKPDSKNIYCIVLWRKYLRLSHEIDFKNFDKNLHNLAKLRDFNIYRKEDVLFQLKIRGASEKFKDQPRHLLMPISVNFCQYCRNLSHETVPLIIFIRSMRTFSWRQ